MNVQVRLRRAKQEWSKRLDDFARNRMTEHTSSFSSATSAASATTTQRSALFPNKHHHHHHNSNHNPFRVLLQLFAEQDVFDNGLLTAAFEWDQGQSLTFLVPQLLSFLLHGATTSSEKLEDWILQTCKTNVFFAHRCYWFLRAWCLEVPGSAAQSTTGQQLYTMSRENSDAQLNAFIMRASHSNQDLQQLQAQQQNQYRTVSSTSATSQTGPLFLDQPAQAETQLSKDVIPLSGQGQSQQPSLSAEPGQIASGGGGISNVTALCRPSNAASGNDSFASDKFMPQERAMIERLMLRVKECGEASAKRLEFGAGRSSNDLGNEATSTKTAKTNTLSLSVRKQAMEMGALPIHPGTGLPSQRHMDCMAAPQMYGFRPISTTHVSSPSSSSSSAAAAASVNDSNNNKNNNHHHHEDSTEHFDKTPQFLDALIYIAELLFTVPRESRKDELQSMLRQVECELLPDNAVYVPSSHVPPSQLGRVWRIAAPECIPISTKERVPCILALEVVQWNDKDRNNGIDDDDHDDDDNNKKKSEDFDDDEEEDEEDDSCTCTTTGTLTPQLAARSVISLPKQHGNRIMTKNNMMMGESTGSAPSVAPGTSTTEPSWSIMDLPRRLSLSTSSDHNRPGTGRDNDSSGLGNGDLLSPDAILSSPGSLRNMVSGGGGGRVARESSFDSSTGVARNGARTPGGGGELIIHRSGSGGSGEKFDSLRQRRPLQSYSRFMSEAELVMEWRRRPRNPLRLVPLINRVGETMKGTMDRVKSSVQERFNDLRE